MSLLTRRRTRRFSSQLPSPGRQRLPCHSRRSDFPLSRRHQGGNAYLADLLPAVDRLADLLCESPPRCRNTVDRLADLLHVAGTPSTASPISSPPQDQQAQASIGGKAAAVDRLADLLRAAGTPSTALPISSPPQDHQAQASLEEKLLPLGRICRRLADSPPPFSSALSAAAAHWKPRQDVSSVQSSVYQGRFQSGAQTPLVWLSS